MTIAQLGAFGHAPRDTDHLLTLIRASRLSADLPILSLFCMAC